MEDREQPGLEHSSSLPALAPAASASQPQHWQALVLPLCTGELTNAALRDLRYYKNHEPHNNVH